MKQEVYNILLASKTPLSAAEISASGKISDRTYVSKILGELAEEGKVESIRDGKSVKYRVVDYVVFLEKNLNLKKVKEDEIWTEIKKSECFAEHLCERLENIIYFAFTEMLNNAIDHSKSSVGYTKIWLEENSIQFVVRDKGIGVFRNFMAKKKLPDEITAIQELIKGKQTTMPKWHSGEGIFWVSKLADSFSLSSYGTKLIVDNSINEYTVDKGAPKVVGTEVYFSIAVNSKKSLQKLFEKYALERDKYSFTTTEIPVRLFEEGEVWISRSQAKKIVNGLERYKKVIFDFKSIKLVGQGFADEIFRVFRKMHPEIILEPINMNKSVELMVRRAMNDDM